MIARFRLALMYKEEKYQRNIANLTITINEKKPKVLEFRKILSTNMNEEKEEAEQQIAQGESSTSSNKESCKKRALEDDDAGAIGDGDGGGGVGEEKPASEKNSPDDSVKEPGPSDNKKRKKLEIAENRVLHFIKTVMEEHETELEGRSESEKKTAAYRKELKTMEDTKKNLKPLKKLLKSKKVASDVLKKLDGIVSLCNEREYAKAVHIYMELAIGNDPWPIGVTQVGIHERKGRERINQSNVAHVMNDEVQRLYLTSIKRLISLKQRFTPTEPSKMIQ